MPDIEFILSKIDRNPIFINDKEKYTEMLYNSTLPILYTDNEEVLTRKLTEYTSMSSSQICVVFPREKERLFEAIENKNKVFLINRLLVLRIINSMMIL